MSVPHFLIKIFIYLVLHSANMSWGSQRDTNTHSSLFKEQEKRIVKEVSSFFHGLLWAS